LYAYWWLTLIMPRPMQIPLAFYLFWTRPEARRGLLVLTAVNVGLVLIVGHGMEWVSYLLTRGAENMNEVFNIHPAADLLWLIVGIPLAVLLTLIGWPGQAGVILWPSLLPQYLLMAFVPPDRRRKIR
jgi:hypothetical protein